MGMKISKVSRVGDYGILCLVFSIRKSLEGADAAALYGSSGSTPQTLEFGQPFHLAQPLYPLATLSVLLRTRNLSSEIFLI
jgi:hypothetical protein